MSDMQKYEASVRVALIWSSNHQQSVTFTPQATYLWLMLIKNATNYPGNISSKYLFIYHLCVYIIKYIQKYPRIHCFM